VLGHPLEELLHGLEGAEKVNPQASHQAKWPLPCLCCCSTNSTAEMTAETEMMLDIEAQGLTDHAAEVAVGKEATGVASSEAEGAASIEAEGKTSTEAQSVASCTEVEDAAITEMLRFAAPDLQADKDIWFTAVLRNGNDLQHAPEQLRKDKDMVIAAVWTTPEAIQYAMGGLNQVHDCLRQSRILEHKEETCSRKEQAILSIKINLAEQGTSYAMQFALTMKDDPYLGQFKTHNPHVLCQKSCDPNFSDVQHPCRGTLDTCLISEQDNLSAEKRPTDTSCWRVAFRFHQEECKATSGFMIQVQEVEGLGAGQKIETEMAEQVGLKVFRTRSHQRSIDGNRIAGVSRVVKACYDSGCENMELKDVWI